jgi:thioredoxin reductase
MKNCDVAIIGAGPYGLSIAAHLRGLNYRIFGSPMHTWSEHMPKGMRLKSDGLASSLYEPDSKFTLDVYCKEKGLPYADLGLPVTLETFVAYGLEFQKRFVPQLEQKTVVSVMPDENVYQIRLADGEVVSTPRVVVAAGLSYYPYVPPALSSLPATHISHNSKYKNLDHFKGQDVVVVGAGASALDTAALLNQAGAHVCVVARTPAIRMWDPPKPAPKSFIEHLQDPLSGLGRGWRLYLCAHAPLIFRMMPQEFRLRKVREVLGPNPAWFIKPDIEGKVPLHPGYSIKDARVEGGRAKLEVTDKSGAIRIFEADHIISATGYRVDLRRLPFLNSDVLAKIRSVENTPVLSSNFESTLPGVYFVGASAANTFGPLLRFAVGAKFTARRLSKHLAESCARDGAQAWKRTVGEKIPAHSV